MSISDNRIQAALDKISKRRKEKFSDAVIANIVEIEQLENPVEKVKRIFAMRDSLVSLAEKSKDNSIDVYDGTIESLTTAINEHFEILASQIKEALSKVA